MLLVLLLAGITYAEVNINKGTLVKPLGQVNLIENIVIVKKNLTELSFCQENANILLKEVDKLLENEKNEEISILLNEVQDRLREITPIRSKRSLLPFVGKLMNSLFGVTVESDFEREKERLDKIENWAKDYGHVINNVIDNINEMAKSFNVLSEEIGQVGEELKEVERKLKIQIIASEINLKLDKIVSLMESVRKAHMGVVDVNLLTISEIEKVIQLSLIKFNFKPLDIDLITYYSMLNVKVVNNMCYILLPFNTENNLLATKIIPFPMVVEGKEIMLLNKAEIVLENKLNLINVWEEEVFESNCLALKERNYICNVPNFFLQPISMYPCIQYQLQGGVDNCIYEKVDYKFKVLFLEHVYIFTTEELTVEISCKDKTEKRSVVNVGILPSNCKLKIPNIFYYTPTVFKNIDLKKTKALMNVNFNSTINTFKIKHHQIKINPMKYFESNIMILYKNSVMPWMTLMFIPVIIIVIVGFYIGVKIFVIRKLGYINSMIEDHLGNEK